jgi:hypothetical protein
MERGKIKVHARSFERRGCRRVKEIRLGRNGENSKEGRREEEGK